MAMTDAIKTRIQLRYGKISEWASNTDKKPLKGEVCVVEIPASDTTKLGADGKEYTIQTPPTVVFKVGDGEKTFGELPIMSALAADVHEWAKDDYNTFIGKVKASLKEGDVKFVDQDAFDALAARVGALETKVENLENIGGEVNTIEGVTGKSGNTVLTAADFTVNADKVVEISDAKIVKAISDGDAATLEAAKKYADEKDDAQYTNKIKPIEDDLSGYKDTVALNYATKTELATAKTAILGSEGSTNTVDGVANTVSILRGEFDTFTGNASNTYETKTHASETYQTIANATTQHNELSGAITTAVNGLETKLTGDNGAITNAQGTADAAVASAQAANNKLAGITKDTVKEYIDEQDAAIVGASTDNKDANTVYGAKAYADSAVATAKTELIGDDSTPDTIKKAIKDAATAQDAADTAQVDATKALNKLSGISEGEGTVKKYVDDAISAIVEVNENGDLDTIKEIANWIGTDEAGAIKTIAGHTASINDHETRIDTLEATVNEDHEGRIDTLEDKVTTLEGKELTDTTYTFASGTNGTFTVTPEGGSPQTVDTGAKDYVDGEIDKVEEAIDGINAKIARFGAANDVLVFNCGTASENW